MNYNKKNSYKTIQKRLIIAILICLIVLLVLVIKDVTYVKAEEKTPSKSEQIMQKIAPGWNLGHSFDSMGGELSLGNPATSKELIKSIKKQGFKSIRIPVTWTGHMDQMNGAYQLDLDYLMRLDQVIAYALEQKLYVVINLYHDSWSWMNKMGSDATVLPRFNAIWQQLSVHYANYSDLLMFEAVNAPKFDDGSMKEQRKLLDTLLQSFVGIVRRSGGENSSRMLLLPTMQGHTDTASCKALSHTIRSLKDDNLIATFQYYGMWDFSVNTNGKYKFDKVVAKDIRNTFDMVDKQFIQNKIPVICGEYSLFALEYDYQAIEHGEMLKYFEYINYYAKKKKVPTMLWDSGKLFNRQTYIWSDKTFYKMLKTSWKKRSSYAKTDCIYVEDETKIKDKTLTLTLNGNLFQDVFYNDQALIKDKDYTYKNKKIVLKKKFIRSIISDQIGENAKVTLRFSKGQDWVIHIIHSMTPVLTPAKGTQDSLVIPTVFSGDELTAMRAVYMDSQKNVGPQDYTAYKEFGFTFYPDYQNNTITITSEFLQAANEGEILLHFQFRSGKKVEYPIVKSKEQVQSKNYEEYENAINIQKLEEKQIATAAKKMERERILKTTIQIYSIIEQFLPSKTVTPTSKGKRMTSNETYIVIGFTMFLGMGGIYCVQRRKNKVIQIVKTNIREL